MRAKVYDSAGLEPHTGARCMFMERNKREMEGGGVMCFKTRFE